MSSLKKGSRDHCTTRYSDDKIGDGVKVSLLVSPLGLGNHNVFCHWDLIFSYHTSGRYYTFGAFSNKGMLDWRCDWSRDAPREKNGSRLHRNFATCRETPSELRALAREISINGEFYNVAVNNCQEWIKCFARKIGGDVYDYIDENVVSFLEDAPVVVAILPTAVGMVTSAMGSLNPF